jgi:radical SAM-linked protein
VLFRFAKRGAATWISHLDLVTVFERALVRAGFRARFTEGFNPKPRMEFASPLALGAESAAEIASVELEDFDGPDPFVERMNRALPPGISVEEAAPMPAVPRGSRKPSLGSAYWGSEYRLGSDRVVLLPKDGPSLKAVRSESSGLEGIERLRVLAAGPGGEPIPYFEAFRSSSRS